MEVSTLDKICPWMTYVNAIKKDSNTFYCTNECARFSHKHNTCIYMVDKFIRIEYNKYQMKNHETKKDT